MKPPYRVPTMREIEATPWNGLNVVSTFSGGGGSCTGYRIAGYRVLWASEFIAEARETYRANHPSSILDPRDIRDVRAEDVLDAVGLKPGELDLLDGSPPCSAFSTAGKRHEGWGKAKAYSDDANQVVDDLFFEYARLLRGIRPRAFVAENVTGLVKGTAKGYYKLILRELGAAGYNVRSAVVNSAWLGVPQARQRLIFVGLRNDIAARGPFFPEPLPYFYSLAEAIAGITEPPEPEASMERYAVGKEWWRLKPGGQSEKYFQLVRPSPHRPVPTITATSAIAGAASVTHPHECRKFSVAECKRLCSFPDDYALTGTYQQKIERMGRSVPPLMMAAIAANVRDNLLGARRDANPV